MTSIKVDVWSDVACPWCYIGKRKLEAAISQFEGLDSGNHIEVEYHSYLLNPDMPVDYEGSQVDYLCELKGFSREQVAQMSERITAIAASVGLNYNFADQIMTNTVLAHQLLHFAKAHGKQVEMKERIMDAHFVKAEHVGRVDDLVRLAAEVGLDADQAREALESGQYLPDFNADIEQARAFGISGVPFFVLNGKYAVSGAQDSSVFVNAFEQLSNEAQ